ncbi:BPI fold-containing family C protein-like, partial [Astatotilapia calliptera]|uniref:BPI fold-containing family C protein-like n=1 Tax=Astatotilapia calliptera TaxID=8154 RepID=UPI000E40EAAE
SFSSDDPGFWLRMKSCVLFFFFLASLISSNTAPPPPGIKLQITGNAKDLGLMYLKGLVNKEFPIDKKYMKMKIVKLIELQVDPAKVGFSFQENIGLQIEIKDMAFSLEIQQEAKIPVIHINMTTLTGEGVTATITVRMNQNTQGHLNVYIPQDNCIINTDTSRTTSTGFKWFWEGDLLRRFYQYLFNNKFCPALQPKINYMLRDLPMMKTVHENRQLDLDYSLSSDIAVKSRSIDISFKGLISVHGQAVDTDSITAGKEPVFTETNKMIYVGISEFFFNGAAMAIYNSGPFEVNVPKLEGLKNLVQKTLKIEPGLWTVELTKAPIIKIIKTGLSELSGLSATVNFKAQHKDQQTYFPMICKVNMDVEFKERLLIVNIQKLKFEDEARSINGNVLVRRQCSNRFTPISLYQQIFIMIIIIIIIIIIITCVSLFVQAFLVKVFHKRITKWLVKEIPIPLPAELSIIDAKTQFEEGYLVVGGSLTFNPQSSSNAGG